MGGDTAPLRIYADRNKTAQWAHIPLLYPFWGLQVKDSLPYLKAAFSKHGWDPSYFSMVDTPGKAEYIVFPHDYWWAKRNCPSLLQEYISLSKKHDVPLLLDGLGDTDEIINVPQSKVLRNTMYRFMWPKNEIPTPYAVEDLLEAYCSDTLMLRDKQATPSIGFIGFSGFTFFERVRMWVKEIPVVLKSSIDRRYLTHRNGRLWRERAIRAFLSSSRVICHFVERPSYSGHAQTVTGDMGENRQEYIQNLLNSDYSLVVRGIPNASQRFYEVLSLGKIPVLIDTECVLPLEDRIRYEDFCVIIKYTELENAPDILADFHAALTPEKYRNMQFKAREIYERYLRIDSFSRYLPELLRT